MAVLCWLPQLSQAKSDYRSIVDITLLGDFYFTEESQTNGQGSGSILIEYLKEQHRFWVDIGAGGLLGSSGHSFVKAPQVFYQYGTGRSYQFYFGRWRTKWSNLDDQWNLGITQGRFLWDSSRPETQGLTGVFFEMNPVDSLFHFTAFASGFFLPDQGASFTLVDGALRSSNPWFFPPVQALSFGGNEFALNYRLQNPNLADILLRPSAGLKLEYNRDRSGFFSRGFFFHKPKNDLILPFEGTLNLASIEGDVTVIPVVAQHNVGGLDVGYRFQRDRGSVGLSWIGEYDVTLEPPTNSTYPEFPDQNLFGASAEWAITSFQRIKASYMKVFRTATLAAGVHGDSNIDVFGFRNRFEEAARLEWTGHFLHKEAVPTLKSHLALTVDPARRDTWIKGQLSWWIRRGLEAMVQCDFFGSQEADIAGDNFLTRFQNNDRCLVGGSYAF